MPSPYRTRPKGWKLCVVAKPASLWYRLAYRLRKFSFLYASEVTWTLLALSIGTLIAAGDMAENLAPTPVLEAYEPEMRHMSQPGDPDACVMWVEYEDLELGIYVVEIIGTTDVPEGCMQPSVADRPEWAEPADCDGPCVGWWSEAGPAVLERLEH